MRDCAELRAAEDKMLVGDRTSRFVFCKFAPLRETVPLLDSSSTLPLEPWMSPLTFSAFAPDSVSKVLVKLLPDKAKFPALTAWNAAVVPVSVPIDMPAAAAACNCSPETKVRLPRMKLLLEVRYD